MSKRYGLVALIGLLALMISAAVIVSAQEVTMNTAGEMVEEDYGFVVFAHTSPDVGAIDIYQGDSTTPIVEDLEYGEHTELFTFPVTDQPFVVRAAGSDPDSAPLVTGTFGVSSNYTALVAAVGLSETATFLLEPLNVIRTDIDDVARVRLVNLIAGDSTFSVRGSAFTEDFGQGLGYLGISDADVEAGDTSFEVWGADGNLITSLSPIELDANTHYAIILYGDVDEPNTTAVMVVATPRETTNVQFVNNSTLNLDLYTSDPEDGLIASLESGDTSEWIELPSGAYTFISKLAGAGADSQDLAGLAMQFYPARDVVIRIDGTEARIEMTLLSEVMSPSNVMAGEAGMMDDATMDADDGSMATAVPAVDDAAPTATPTQSSGATSTTVAPTTVGTLISTLVPTVELTNEGTPELTSEPDA